MNHFTQDPDHRGKGTSDGIFQHETYFNCVSDCGLFVSLEKLWFKVGTQGELQSQQLHELASGHQSVNNPSLYAAVTSSQSHHSQPPHGHKKLRASEVDPPRMRFKVDDQVVVFDKRNTPLYGSVRWIGRKNLMGRDMGELHIGIEMVTIENKISCYGCTRDKKNKKN
jgi:hypothetical protein